MNHTPDTPGTDTTATPSRTLRNAALYLTRHGWVTGRWFADTDGWLPAANVLGAIAMAAIGRPVREPYRHESADIYYRVHGSLSIVECGCDFCTARTVLELFLTDYFRGPAVDLSLYELTDAACWNDEPDQTCHGVVAMLEAAAYRWEADPSPDRPTPRKA
jgi:hypothetical protein